MFCLVDADGSTELGLAAAPNWGFLINKRKIFFKIQLLGLYQNKATVYLLKYLENKSIFMKRHRLGVGFQTQAAGYKDQTNSLLFLYLLEATSDTIANVSQMEDFLNMCQSRPLYNF